MFHMDIENLDIFGFFWASSALTRDFKTSFFLLHEPILVVFCSDYGVGDFFTLFRGVPFRELELLSWSSSSSSSSVEAVSPSCSAGGRAPPAKNSLYF